MFHVCVYFFLCVSDALLIKLMDSGAHSSTSPVPSLSLSLYSLRPAIKAINTLQQQILLSNVTRKIHYGVAAGEGDRETGRNKGSRISRSE